MAEGKWMRSYRDESSFDLSLEHSLENFNGPTLVFTSDKNGLGCIRCDTVLPIEPCSNCAHQVFKLALSETNTVGLFCQRCRRGYTSWSCMSCGTVNPLTAETLYKDATKGCFIATAACGDVNAPEVIYLTAFRDKVLSKTKCGQMFVETYYAVSPSIAVIISKMPPFKWLTRVLVLKPVVRLLRLFGLFNV